MSVPAAVTCPTCHAPVAPGSSFCTRCGAVLAVREIAVEVGGDAAWGGAPRRRREAAAAAGGPPPPPGAAVGVDTAFRELQGGIARPTTNSAATPAGGDALGPAFDGVTPAGPGRRIAAFAIDSALAGAVAAAVWVLTDGPVYAALAALELAAGQVVWEARSGRTVGNALLGLRAAQDDVPYAPGLGRSLARAALVGAGHLVLGLGQWLVVASTAFDGSGRRQGWHDKLASTVVVDVRALSREEAPVAVHAPVVTGPVAVPGVPDASVVPDPDLPDPYAPVLPPVRPTAGPGVPPPPPATAIAPSRPTPPPPATPQPDPPASTAQAVAVHPTPPPPPTVTASSGSTTDPGRPPASTPPPPPATEGGTAPDAPAPSRPAASYVVTLDDGRAMSVSGPGYVGRRPQAPAGERVDHVIEIDDPGRSLSRTHARFGIDERGFWVEDNGSANGTSVLETDGTARAGAPGERLHVPDGGTVRLGERTFTVHPYA